MAAFTLRLNQPTFRPVLELIGNDDVVQRDVEITLRLMLSTWVASRT